MGTKLDSSNKKQQNKNGCRDPDKTSEGTSCPSKSGNSLKKVGKTTESIHHPKVDNAGHGKPADTSKLEKTDSSSTSATNLKSNRSVNVGKPPSGNNTSTPVRRFPYSDRRRASQILRKLASTSGLSAEDEERVKWAKSVMPDFDPAFTSKVTQDDTVRKSGNGTKRDRSSDASLPLAKRSRGVQNKSFADVVKDKIMLGLVDRGSANGFIQKSRWPGVRQALNANIVPFIREHKCAIPCTTEAGWYQGQIKAMACDDVESANIFKRMVAGLGEVYPGAKIEALNWEDLPSFPRARVWLTAIPDKDEDILQLLQASNPKLPNSDWRIIKNQEAVGWKREVVVTLNKETVDLIKSGKGELRYGFNTVNAHLYRADVRALNLDSHDIGDSENHCEDDTVSLLSEEREFGGSVSDGMSDLAEVLEGVGVESDEDTDVTIVEKRRSKQDVSDNLADKPPPQ